MGFLKLLVLSNEKPALKAATDRCHEGTKIVPGTAAKQIEPSRC